MGFRCRQPCIAFANDQRLLRVGEEVLGKALVCAGESAFAAIDVGLLEPTAFGGAIIDLGFGTLGEIVFDPNEFANFTSSLWYFPF